MPSSAAIHTVATARWNYESDLPSRLNHCSTISAAFGIDRRGHHFPEGGTLRFKPRVSVAAQPKAAAKYSLFCAWRQTSAIETQALGGLRGGEIDDSSGAISIAIRCIAVAAGANRTVADCNVARFCRHFAAHGAVSAQLLQSSMALSGQHGIPPAIVLSAPVPFPASTVASFKTGK